MNVNSRNQTLVDMVECVNAGYHNSHQVVDVTTHAVELHDFGELATALVNLASHAALCWSVRMATNTSMPRLRRSRLSSPTFDWMMCSSSSLRIRRQHGVVLRLTFLAIWLVERLASCWTQSSISRSIRSMVVKFQY